MQAEIEASDRLLLGYLCECGCAQPAPAEKRHAKAQRATWPAVHTCPVKALASTTIFAGLISARQSA